MAADDFLIAGLGNPGAKYEQTRHNVGFMALDRLACRHGLGLAPCKWDALLVRPVLWGRRVCLVKPDTFMNRSGRAIAGIARFYSISAANILIIHDDLDMHPGRIKLVAGGGTGGHNGIRSLVEHLGTSDFFRLKIGIGRPGSSDVHPDMPVDKFVLSPFSPQDAVVIAERLDLLEPGIRAFVEGDAGRAMNLLNGIK